jgi:hypothetical protein
MSGQPIASPSDDTENPFAPPRAETGEFCGNPETEAEAIRQANRGDEAYLKAMGLGHLALAVCLSTGAFYYLTIAVMHAQGDWSAPWIVRPGWIAFQGNHWVMAIAAAFAGYGFLRYRLWAFRVEALFLLCLFFWWLLTILLPTKALTVPEFLVWTFLLLAVAVPLWRLPDVRQSVVMQPDYQRVIKATPHIRVKHKIPTRLRIISGFFLVAAIICVYLAMPGR